MSADDEQYRGVLIPDDVRRDRDENSPYAARFHAWKRGVDAALGVAVPLVESLRYDSECSLDHHGYCQEHGLPGAIPCPDGEARKFITETKGRDDG